jgi:hypothetical protein
MLMLEKLYTLLALILLILIKHPNVCVTSPNASLEVIYGHRTDGCEVSSIHSESPSMKREGGVKVYVRREGTSIGVA